MQLCFFDLVLNLLCLLDLSVEVQKQKELSTKFSFRAAFKSLVSCYFFIYSKADCVAYNKLGQI